MKFPKCPPFILAIISGILIGTSFIPFPPWGAFFAFAPLLKAWNEASTLKKVFLYGWITQFVLTAIGFNWVTITLHDFGKVPWPVAIIGFLIFCGFASLYIPLAGFIGQWISRKLKFSPSLKIIFLLCLLAIFEPLIPTIFPFNFGYTFMTSSLPIKHLGEVIGFSGISTLVILSNAITYYILWPSSLNFSRPMAALTLVILISFVTMSGFFIKSNIKEPDSSIKVSIIQANVGDILKELKKYGSAQFRKKIIEKYVDLSKSELENETPDFFVWPETAAPVNLGKNNQNKNKSFFINQIYKNNLSVVTGAYTQTKTGQTTNSMLFFDHENGQVEPHYNKTHLLAFGEYIPGSKWFPVFKKWLPQVSDFKPGNGPQITTFKGLKIGTQICYESLFPKFNLGLAQLGAQVVINLTNDSWYGDYQEPYQHLNMTLARAIESRRPLIRSTNTGISTVILASGEVLEQSKPNEIWTHTFTIPYNSEAPLTFYNRFPNLIPYLVLILMFCLLIFGFIKRKKTEQTPPTDSSDENQEEKLSLESDISFDDEDKST